MLKRLLRWISWVIYEKGAYTQWAFDHMLEAREKGKACQVRMADVWFGKMQKMAKQKGIVLYVVVNTNKDISRTYLSMFDARTLRLKEFKGEDTFEVIPDVQKV